ncbi:MAG: HAMP domain-containing protein [Lysobacter sp.]|nr:MAG: HAMP domain-containing protein [Lysobacter sp.]
MSGASRAASKRARIFAALSDAFGRLHTRLLLLLAAVVIASVAATAFAFGLTTRESSAERAARMLHAQVIAADALLAESDRVAAEAQLRRLGLRWRDRLPEETRAEMPWLRKIETRAAARLPGRAMRLSGSPPRLWVRDRSGDGWIGVPLLAGAEPFKRGLALSLLAIVTLVLAAAAIFARTLTRPLRRLADVAPAIVAGEAPPPLRFASAEMRELQDSLAQAADATRAVARDRELMLAGLSHDMRTPLARLRYGLALMEGDGDAEGREAMERDIDEIDAIVGQFIDYVRDGRDEAETEVDLAELLREQEDAEARAGRDWALVAPECAALHGRPLALRRAIGNLVANAVKHGAAPFELQLEACPPDPESGLAEGWRLRVSDRGPGVPQERLNDLGRPFHRVDTARGTPGSGLGLASVARVAAVHRGALRLRNREGGGLEAELRLAFRPD